MDDIFVAPITRHLSRARIFLVDAEAAVLRGLELLFASHPALKVCGTAADDRTALAQILKLQPDLAIVDLRLRAGEGSRLISELRAFCPGLKILVFSMHTETAAIQKAIAAGADGFVCREMGTERLLECVCTLLFGSKSGPRAPEARLAAATEKGESKSRRRNRA